VGPRPVLKGRTTAGMVGPKGVVGTYSYYPNYSTSSVLDGAPDNHHVPGSGRYPGNLFLSQIFTGSELYIHPLSGTFQNGIGQRFSPGLNRSVDSSKAFTVGFGHAKRVTDYSVYSNYIFDGVASADATANAGHAKRTTAYSLYNNDIFDGVASAVVMPSGYGQANTTSEYGRNKVGEYNGVASAKAL